MKKTRFEIRRVDAYHYDGEWVYNSSSNYGEFETAALNERKAFTRALSKLGIRFLRGRTRITFDGDLYEVCDRKTGEPLFAAIPAPDFFEGRDLRGDHDPLVSETESYWAAGFVR